MKNVKHISNSNKARIFSGNIAPRLLASMTAGLMVAAPIALNPTTAHAQVYNSPIQVTVNGQYINVGDVAPTVENGRVLVPLRGVLESLGATVDYNPATATVSARRGATQLSLQIGSTQAFVNGRATYLDVPARTITGRTVVPLRFMSEALGATVNWNSSTRTVAISTGAGTGTGGGVVVPPDNTYYPPTSQLPTEQSTTIYGTVSRDLRNNGRRLEVTTDTGVVVEVRNRNNTLNTFNVGDYVVVQGQYRNNVFVADSISLVNNAGGNAVVRGTVVSVISGNRITVRGDNGVVFTAISNTPLSVNVTPGDIVQVSGTRNANNNNVRNATVTLLTNVNNNPVTGQNVDFRATVVSYDEIGRSLQVRGDNGQIYLVRYFGNERFYSGDRVRVVGNAYEGVTTATSVSRY